LSRKVKTKICKTIILPFVLYECETWSLTLREENRLRIYENRVLRRIFGSERDQVTGEWRKLHSGELHNLYSSPDIIRAIKSRRIRRSGYVERMAEEKKCARFRWESPKERGHSEDRGIDGRMGLEWILGRLVGGVWIVFTWVMIGTGGVLS
jgi:hypothetical protein